MSDYAEAITYTWHIVAVPCLIGIVVGLVAMCLSVWVDSQTVQGNRK